MATKSTKAVSKKSNNPNAQPKIKYEYLPTSIRGSKLCGTAKKMLNELIKLHLHKGELEFFRSNKDLRNGAGISDGSFRPARTLLTEAKYIKWRYF